MLTKKGLADYLKVTDRTIDRYRKAGMPCIITFTGLVRFDLDAVMVWFAEKNKKEV